MPTKVLFRFSKLLKCYFTERWMWKDHEKYENYVIKPYVQKVLQ